MKTLLLAVLLVACAACSTTYRKPGASEEDFDNAITECESKAGQAGIYGIIPRTNFVKRCMRGQGWSSN